MQMEALRAEVPADFGDNSKVWIYQSSRRFTDEQQMCRGRDRQEFGNSLYDSEQRRS